MTAEAIPTTARARTHTGTDSTLLGMFQAPDHGETRVIRDGMSWQDYMELDALRDEQGGFRVAYLDGVIEIMFPSFEHEIRKSNVSRVLEAWLERKDLAYTVHGSTTLRNEIKKAGKEPDESYAFGDERKERPDLAIEIAITSGGIDTLSIYRRWAIPEVWIWHKGTLSAFVFEGDNYIPASQSRRFPDLDLSLLVECAKIEKTSEARKKFLSAMKSAGG